MSKKTMSRAWDSYGLTPIAKLVYLRCAEQAFSDDGERQENALLFVHTVQSWCGCTHEQMVAALHELQRQEEIAGWRFVEVKDEKNPHHDKARTYTAVVVFFAAPDSYYEGDYEDIVEQPTTADIVSDVSVVTKIDPRRERIYAKTGGKCFYCVEASAEQLDHMHPSSRGGSDADENMIGACTGCNIQKKDRTVEEYRAYLAYKRRAASTAEIVFYGETKAA